MGVGLAGDCFSSSLLTIVSGVDADLMPVDLETHFCPSLRTILEHPEGHRVPRDEDVLRRIAGSIRAALQLSRPSIPRTPYREEDSRDKEREGMVQAMPASSRILPPFARL